MNMDLNQPLYTDLFQHIDGDITPIISKQIPYN